MVERINPSYLDRSVGHQLGRAYNRFWQACAECLRPHRITPKQFALLSLICRNPGIAQSAICQRTVTKPSLVAEALEALSARRLIRRATDPDDRRRRVWSPTAKGLRLEEILQRKVISMEQEVCAGSAFAVAERTELFSLLARINSADVEPILSPEAASELPPQQLRRSAGSFATGVTIVAVARARRAHGMTANSFLSVSLAPPLVLFSLRQSARLRGMLTVGKRIGISILARGQERISDHFAGRGKIDFDVFAGSGDPPSVNGAHAVYHVVLEDIVAAGDHELFICRVEATRFSGGQPLIFHGGSYASIASGAST